MNCIELLINGKTFRIVKDELVENGQLKQEALALPAVEPAGEPSSYIEENKLIGEFLKSGGKPPKGYTVFAEDENHVIQKLDKNDYETLINALHFVHENRDNENRRMALATGDYKDFVNKVICNASTESTDLIQQKNVLYSKFWGNNRNWYGFTNRRFVILTGYKGNTSKYNSNFEFLNNIYLEIKDGNQSTINLINSIYNGDNKTADIYEKLTHVANYQLADLKRRKLRFNAKVLSGKDLRAQLHKHNTELLNTFFVSGSTTFMLESFGVGDQVLCKIIYDKNSQNSIGETKMLNIKDVHTLYYPKSISMSVNKETKTWTNYGGVWFNSDNKVETNETIIDALNNGIYDTGNLTDEFVDTYNMQLFADSSVQINKNEKINILEYLQPGDAISTNYGIITKQKDGKWTQEDGTPISLSGNRIFAIKTANAELAQKILEQYQSLDSKRSYNKGQMKVIIQQMLSTNSDGEGTLDVSKYGTVKFLDHMYNPVSIKNNTNTEGVVEPVLYINSRFNLSNDNIHKLQAAIKIWKMYQNGKLEGMKNLATSWDAIYDVIFEGKKPEQKSTGGKTFEDWQQIINSCTPVGMEETFENWLSENMAQSTSRNDLSTAKSLLNKLIEDGMVVEYCELG